MVMTVSASPRRDTQIMPPRRKHEVNLAIVALNRTSGAGLTDASISCSNRRDYKSLFSTKVSMLVWI